MRIRRRGEDSGSGGSASATKGFRKSGSSIECVAGRFLEVQGYHGTVILKLRP